MILLFDGVCNLCNGFVQFVIRQDPQGLVQFASLQSEAGQALLQQYDLPTADFKTVVLIHQGQVYTHSKVVLTLMPALGWQWQWLRLGWLMPGAWRDFLYNWVAANRYRWFGKQDACMLPTPELQARFL